MLLASPKQERFRRFLFALQDAPPQSIVFEGGTIAERNDATLLWACLLNCQSENRPCFECQSCQQVLEGVHRDVVLLDGREGQIKIDEVREVRRLMGEPPRNDGKRVIILAEAHNIGVEAANCLLKSMEEPRPGNVFVLTAPQRERLLPTLVSRSWVLTLAWPDTAERPEPEEDGENPATWNRALQDFWDHGKGWFALTGARSRMSKQLAESVLVDVQRDLAAILSKNAETPERKRLTAMIDKMGSSSLVSILDKAKESLDYNVNATLVMDWVAVTVYNQLRQ